MFFIILSFVCCDEHALWQPLQHPLHPYFPQLCLSNQKLIKVTLILFFLIFFFYKRLRTFLKTCSRQKQFFGTEEFLKLMEIFLPRNLFIYLFILLLTVPIFAIRCFQLFQVVPVNFYACRTQISCVNFRPMTKMRKRK